MYSYHDGMSHHKNNKAPVLAYIGIKIDFGTKVKINFTAYNAKNKILSPKILFYGYI